jgi:hypothetical protein
MKTASCVRPPFSLLNRGKLSKSCEEMWKNSFGEGKEVALNFSNFQPFLNFLITDGNIVTVYK